MAEPFEHARRKLDAARYFRAQLDQTGDQPRHFAYNLEAFLMEWRSIFPILSLSDLQARPERLRADAWVVDRIKKDPLFEALKQKRDIAVHRAPLMPSGSVMVMLEEHVSPPEEFLEIELRDTAGHPVQRSEAPPDPPAGAESETYTIHFTYRFPDLPDGPREDLRTIEIRVLCDRLIAAAEDFLCAAAAGFPSS